MTTPSQTTRRGMSLVELLVVVMILGLLGVLTIPLINTSGSKRQLREAAASVESHLNQAVSRSLGSRAGHGAWFQADDTSSSLSPTTLLNFCAGVTEVSGSATLTLASATATSGSVALTPSYAAITGSTSYLSAGPPAGTLIRFVGFPYDYSLTTATTVSFPASQSSANFCWPVAATLPFFLSIPPGKTTVGKTALRGNTCVDLTCSTVGVHGYSVQVRQASNAAPLIISFDSLGKARAVTFRSVEPGGSTVLRQEPLMANIPVALLVGLRDQVGAAQVATPTENDPGANWQRNDAWWVVLDPRTATIFSVENTPNAASITAAQKFIRQKLLNDSTAQ